MFVGTLKIVVLIVGVCHGKLLDVDFCEISSRTTFADKLQKILQAHEDEISPICKTHVAEYAEELQAKKFWALRMFDAGAKVPVGLLEGNLVELGSFDECLKVKKLSNTSGIIMGKYCLGKIPIEINLNAVKEVVEIESEFSDLKLEGSVRMQIQLATCLPHSCSAIDVQRIYEQFDLGMVFDETSCQTKTTHHELDTVVIISLSVFGFILLVMVAATVYDVILFYLQKSPIHPLLIAFSVLTNGRNLMATSRSSRQISCLHGIRVISTLWVILFHRYKIQFKYPMKNYVDQISWIKDDANMFVVNASLSVDTFLLMAGLVISYGFMNNVAKGTRFNVITYYIHRYLRLTPVFAVIILIHVTLLQHLGSGPLWPNTIQPLLIDGCEKYWWKSLLYIQNYWRGGGAACVPQSWYLCVDTQLFLLSPLLLIPLKRWPNVTLWVTGFLSVCSVITSFLAGWFYDLNSSLFGNLDKEKLENYMKYYYVPTHTRASPWLIGIILGYFIFQIRQTNKPKLWINKLVVLSLWVAALAVLCACVFAGNNLIFGEHHHDKVRNSLYMALQRPAWSITVGWVIFACVSGFGGPVNWFLSLPLFEVVSKFTYSLYLVHYTAICITIAQMRTTPVFNNANEMYAFCGDLVLTSVFAVILTLAFESPITTIEKFILGPSQDKNKTAIKAGGKSSD